MKFYNLYKLDVKVGDTVYDPYFKTCERVVFVDHRVIKTKPGSEYYTEYCSYYLNGYLRKSISMHSLICNLISRIIKL
jgi:hypothetical protein